MHLQVEDDDAWLAERHPGCKRSDVIYELCHSCWKLEQDSDSEQNECAQTPMKYRKLRIAWSVGWGIVAVVLCVLWMRSYTWGDNLMIPVSQSSAFRFSSGNGILLMKLDERPKKSTGWHYGRISMIQMQQLRTWFIERGGPAPIVNTVNRWGINGHTVRAPHWFFVLLLAAFGAAPWIGRRRRFSLRTLLVATTLVAVLLGLIVYAVRG
jgi:hypothetical protein